MIEKQTDQVPGVIRFYRSIWRLWKEKRFRRFVEKVRPRKSESLLDIGGYPFNWFSRGEVIGKVDVLNLGPVPKIENAADKAPDIRAISGDARELEFPDRSYDIVFSNSVIEHVGGFDDQKAFATEARRVAKRLWVQTPAKACPIEPHYLGLFVHWFPPSWHASIARWTSIRGITGSASPAELTAIGENTRLLNRKEFSMLFPDCEIWTERLLWVFPKSYVAIRLDPNSAVKPQHS